MTSTANECRDLDQTRGELPSVNAPGSFDPAFNRENMVTYEKASVCLICSQVWEIWVRVHNTPVDRVEFNPSISSVHQSVGNKFNIRSPLLRPEFQSDSFDSHTLLGN